MKTALVVVLIALVSSPAHAQGSIEQDFERERRSLSLVRYAEGEDATSGWDYLVYKRKSQVRKIRSVYNGGCCSAPEIEDFYFKDGSPVLYVKLSARKAQLGQIIRGSSIHLKVGEKLYLTESKLTMWIENEKTIPPSDPRWKDREKSLLEAFKDQLENYRANKEER